MDEDNSLSITVPQRGKRGIECSAGFNRVGDIYRYPHDANFREKYSLASDSLFDFGVPITLWK